MSIVIEYVIDSRVKYEDAEDEEGAKDDEAEELDEPEATAEATDDG